MLSYQHSYHAGGRADIHKHDILARALEIALQKPSPFYYLETHAGRGVYDLTSTESLKTGEAKDGWLKLHKDKKSLYKMSKPYIEAVRLLNRGNLAPLYPGSPYIAAHMAHKTDELFLYELHPAEHDALQQVFKKDKRVMVHKRNGLDAVLAFAGSEKTKPNANGLVLVDPSYEVTSEYETIPDFVLKLHALWPNAEILIWAPMLPAKRHEILLEKIKAGIPNVAISELTWVKPEDGRGMYGSLMLGINQVLNPA